MKIIEAMKRVKLNLEKIKDLQAKIAVTCANTNVETPLYGAETRDKITGWLQSCEDLAQDNVKMLLGIQRTNLTTKVSIMLGDKSVEKTISEWVWRRRHYALLDQTTWAQLTDRGLREGNIQSSTGVPTEIKIVRHYDPSLRDQKVTLYKSEPHEIDMALEIVNATTDLLEGT